MARKSGRFLKGSLKYECQIKAISDKGPYKLYDSDPPPRRRSHGRAGRAGGTNDREGFRQEPWPIAHRDEVSWSGIPHVDKNSNNYHENSRC